MLPVRERVLDRKRAAPGLPEQIEVAGVEAEPPTHLPDLVDEGRNIPQVRVVGLVAVRRTELVVVVVLDAGHWKIGVASLEVLVRRTRSAVQQKDLHFRVVADALGPDPELASWRGNRDQLHAA